MLKYLFGKKKKLPPVLNQNSLSKIQEKLNLTNLLAFRKVFRAPRPTQKHIAVLSGKPRLNKKHTQSLTAQNIQKMGYPRGPYPRVRFNNEGGEFTEGTNTELSHFLSKNIAKRKKIPHMEFILTPGIMQMSYNNLLTMESRNTRKSKNNINKSVRRRAPRGLEYMYGKHHNYPGVNNNYRRGINKLRRYQNSVPNKVRGALNRIAS